MAGFYGSMRKISSVGRIFEKAGKIKGIVKPQRVCDFRDRQIRGCEKLGSRIGFFLLNVLPGGNANLLLEKLGEMADMITGGLSHLRDGDLFGKMILHIAKGIGQRRIKILSSQRNGFRRLFRQCTDQSGNRGYGETVQQPLWNGRYPAYGYAAGAL